MFHINYEEQLNAFENDLQEKLRGHSMENGFLNLWVPDPDVVSSILNMWDAASCAEIDKLRVDIKNELINEKQLSELEQFLSTNVTVNYTFNQNNECYEVTMESI